MMLIATISRREYFCVDFFICNDSSVCDGNTYLKMCVRDLSESYNFLESKSAMVLSVPFMFLEYRDIPFFMRVHPNHRNTMSWGYSLNGPNEALWIHPRVLALYVNYRI